MSPTLDAFLRSWPWDPWLVTALVVTGGIYLRGVRASRSGKSNRWRVTAFLAGLATIYLALASPIEPFAELLLSVHMLQHMLLMMVAPVLLWLGAPLVPLVRGLPMPVRRYWVAPLLGSRAWRRFAARLGHPFCALPLFVTATWFWHIPRIYEWALRSSAWHYIEHACFLGTALVFWYPVVQPALSRPRWSAWLLFPYLIVADVQNTLLAALLTFSNHVLYPHYALAPRLAGITALDDQATAGVIMWVPGSIAFLVPLFASALRALYGAGERQAHVDRQLTLPVLQLAETTPRPARRQHGFDLLCLPLLGGFLRWRHARLTLQFPLAALAGVVIYDGLVGPQVAPMNLAGVLPWIHWRGLLILSLLTMGNVFCMACPFTLPRSLARRWLPVGSTWPRWLRSKWLAVMLLIVFLWAYEALSLWNSPWWTAWIAVAYFALAFVVDGFFRGAAFCKYVCPIGQFNFVQSLVSPWEVKVRDPQTCTTCATKDCIRGNPGIQGCQLSLFLPRKSGNMDCTFCLDCVHACPHDNVGILGTLPGSDLWHDAPRSGVGRFAQRPDLAVLVVVLVFGAFANAAGMVGPVVAWQAWLTSQMGAPSPLLVSSLFYFTTLLLLPLLAVAVAAWVSQRWGQSRESCMEIATRYSFALVPLGFGMWLAHYSFHFLTSYDAAVPTVQRFVSDLGWHALGTPHWTAACCCQVAEWLPRLEVVFLEFGLLLSLYTGYRITLAKSSRLSQSWRSLAPWALLITLLFTVGIWLVFQPMEMRGT